jgi:hypothetical protein
MAMLHRRHQVIFHGSSNHCRRLSKRVTNLILRLVGAVAVTVPTCWYLIKNGPEADHGHGSHGDKHVKEHGDEHDKEHAEEEPKEEPEGSDDDKSSEKGDDSDNGDGSKEGDTPATSDDEDDGEAKSKDGTTSGTPPTPKGDKKVVPDSKGANKKLIDSDKEIKQGTPEDMADGHDESKDTVIP